MELRTVFAVLAVGALLVLALAAAALYLAYRRLRHIRLAPTADFLTTVRAVPLSLVIGLDLLDIGLDVFSTPLTWFILNRLGLKSLRNVATLKAVVPLADMLPLLTLTWIAARYWKLGAPPDPHLIETTRVGPGQYAPREGR
ncbi:MAG: hypothetical protein M3O15_07340 [Acidobacteriota bacterium]|nr:hypothetical protein [Acidobacteriota bacterium]